MRDCLYDFTSVEHLLVTGYNELVVLRHCGAA